MDKLSVADSCPCYTSREPQTGRALVVVRRDKDAQVCVVSTSSQLGPQS